jgi:hypothetical protein
MRKTQMKPPNGLPNPFADEALDKELAEIRAKLLDAWSSTDIARLLEIIDEMRKENAELTTAINEINRQHGFE